MRKAREETLGNGNVERRERLIGRQPANRGIVWWGTKSQREELKVVRQVVANQRISPSEGNTGQKGLLEGKVGIL